MQIVYEYSHLGGSEILQVRYPKYEKEIYEVIEKVTANKTKISKERTMKGKKLYSPTDMNKQFDELFSVLPKTVSSRGVFDEAISCYAQGIASLRSQ